LQIAGIRIFFVGLLVKVLSEKGTGSQQQSEKQDTKPLENY